MDKRGAIALLRAQRLATLEQLTALAPSSWDEPCLAPWRVREVVAHLITLDEAAVTGRLLPLLRVARGRADVERWNDSSVAERAAADPRTLLEDLERAGERVVSSITKIPAPLWSLPVRTVFGRHPLAFLPARRVLDEWVHCVDICRVTGGVPALPDGVAPAIANAVLDSLPALVLPQLDATAGVVRLVVTIGAVGEDGEHTPRRTWSVDFARRQYGPRVSARPDATVRLHATSLALLAEGRPLLDEHSDVRVDGDPEIAARLIEGIPAAAR
jgi:uncharacterized protein (TIGR03083 family)